MEEIKVRFNIINFTYQNKIGFPPEMVREICYLQFRLICETIALGSIIMHGDVPKTKALNNSYKPHEIIDILDGIKPYFYPQPYEIKMEGEVENIIGRNDLVHLSKDELKVLWGKSGDILHKGKILKLLKTAKNNLDDFKDIFEWSKKLTNLLNSHLICLAENKKIARVDLATLPDNKAEASIIDIDKDSMKVKVYNMKVK